MGDWVFLNGWGPACVRGTLRQGVNVCVCVSVCVWLFFVRCISLLCLEGALEWNWVIEICPIILDLLCSFCGTIVCACWLVITLLLCY